MVRRAGGGDDDFGANGESDWMEKARATANKRAAEFRKDRGAGQGPSRRGVPLVGDADRARTAAVRGYEMDDEGNYVKPEPSVEELLRHGVGDGSRDEAPTQFP